MHSITIEKMEQYSGGGNEALLSCLSGIAGFAVLGIIVSGLTGPLSLATAGTIIAEFYADGMLTAFGCGAWLSSIGE